MEIEGQHRSPSLREDGDGNGEYAPPPIIGPADSSGDPGGLAPTQQLVQHFNREVTFSDEVVSPDEHHTPGSRFDADSGNMFVRRLAAAASSHRSQAGDIADARAAFIRAG
jgi:hypothetical protein